MTASVDEGMPKVVRRIFNPQASEGMSEIERRSPFHTTVPFLDLSRQHQEIATEADEALRRVAAGGDYILGREVEAFEREWAAFCGVAGAVAVASGTDALTLALLASGVVRKGRGDEVITTPLTAAYTALAIVNAGGVPVFADICPRSLTLDPAAVERAITPRTRAVVPVHLYGRLADMQTINNVAARYGLTVIEDAAQAHGASINGRRAGAFGHAAAFSFYPTKNLGAYGDGGAIVSDDPELLERARILRQGGHPEALRRATEGRNSRLDEIQAAVLRIKLRRLEEWNRRRRETAHRYSSAFERTKLIIPKVRDEMSHVYHLYVVRHAARDRLRAHLDGHRISTMIHYPFLLHQQPLFSSGARSPLPVAERVVGELLSLPLHPHLTEEETSAVIAAVLDFEKDAE